MLTQVGVEYCRMLQCIQSWDSCEGGGTLGEKKHILKMILCSLDMEQWKFNGRLSYQKL